MICGGAYHIESSIRSEANRALSAQNQNGLRSAKLLIESSMAGLALRKVANALHQPGWFGKRHRRSARPCSQSEGALFDEEEVAMHYREYLMRRKTDYDVASSRSWSLKLSGRSSRASRASRKLKPSEEEDHLALGPAKASKDASAECHWEELCLQTPPAYSRSTSASKMLAAAREGARNAFSSRQLPVSTSPVFRRCLEYQFSDSNIRQPSERCEDWTATDAGGFAPVSPDILQV